MLHTQPKRRFGEKGHDFWSQPDPAYREMHTGSSLAAPVLSSPRYLAIGWRRHRPCSVQAWLGHPAEVAGLGQVGEGRTHSHLETDTQPPQTELREAAAGMTRLLPAASLRPRKVPAVQVSPPHIRGPTQVQ